MTDTQTRVLHGILGRLGIESPFTDVLQRQDATMNLRVQAADLAEQSRRRRRELAAALVDGTRKLDYELLTDYRESQLAFVSPVEKSVADLVIDQAIDLARSATGAALHPAAASLFERFRTEAAAVVDDIAELPKPPAHIWAAPQHERVLARDRRHVETLGKLALASERFWLIQEGVKIVRDPAGFGFERFGDCTRDALVWRQWERVLDGKVEMRAAHRQLRLWWAILEGWEPGVWKPEDIGGPVKLSFGERLAKLGSAVTGG